MRKLTRLRGVFAPLALGVALGLSPGARAASMTDIAQQATQISGEATELDRTIKRPSEEAGLADVPRRRYIEAQVAYGTGNYADASILLFDVVERFPNDHIYHDAVFLLADSLYMRGANLTAKKYFRMVVDQFGENDANYPKAVERLLELSLRLQDQEGVPDLLARLDRIPAGRALASGPYVKGKFAYFTGDYAGAAATFGAISQGNEWYFEARYFLAAAQIKQDDLAGAVKTLYDLLQVQPRSKKDHRVVELTHMALGRLHYTRDQPTEAIDQYLMVSRRSDLFDDALYEVAFVYVRSKQFDKALRALELLEMATGGSCAKPTRRVDTVLEMPDVCILKGNLGIRKAQSFFDDGKGNPLEEYSTSLAIFEHTRDAYEGPRAELEKIVAANEDPKKYFDAVTSRDEVAFGTGVALPAVARKFIREEPEVARIVVTTEDLREIRADIDEADKTIARLDRVVNSPQRVHVFPTLAEKRDRLFDLGERLFKLRMQVAAAEEKTGLSSLSGADRDAFQALVDRRAKLQQELSAMPGGDASFSERVKLARAKYEGLEGNLKEVEVQIGSLEAQLVAIEKYRKDMIEQGKGAQMDEALFNQTVAEIRAQITELRAQLEATRDELTQAKDEAGLGDDIGEEARRIRGEMMEIARQEHAMLTGRNPEIDGTLAQIEGAQASVDRVQQHIDQILDTELASVRAELETERAALADGKAKLAEYEGENVTLGGEIITASFGTVSKKFYEISIRAEVGVIDVSWAKKEESEANFNRIEVESSREKRTLESEFSEVSHDEPAPAPSPEDGK